MMEWQPIETAPKDRNTRIDLWCVSADGVQQWRETNMSTDVSKLTDRELDAWAAEIMGESIPAKPTWQDGELALIGSTKFSDGGNWIVCVGSSYEIGEDPVWVPRPFTRDRNATALVLEKIREAHLNEEFAWHLDYLMHGDEPAKGNGTVYGLAAILEFIQATPRQLMEAAYLAWEGARK